MAATASKKVSTRCATSKELLAASRSIWHDRIASETAFAKSSAAGTACSRREGCVVSTRRSPESQANEDRIFISIFEKFWKQFVIACAAERVAVLPEGDGGEGAGPPARERLCISSRTERESQGNGKSCSGGPLRTWRQKIERARVRRAVRSCLAVAARTVVPSNLARRSPLGFVPLSPSPYLI